MSLSSAIDKALKNKLLKLGVVSMSLVEQPNAQMWQVVDNLASQPLNANISAALTAVIREAGSDASPQLSLGLLNSFIKEQMALPGGQFDDGFFSRNLKGNIVIFVITLLCVLTRFGVRKFMMNKLKWDDAAIALAMLVNFVYFIILGRFGKHYQTCIHVWYTSWNTYRWGHHGLFNSQVMYIINAYFSRMAIMSFYWTIVPRNTTITFFHRSILAAMALITVISVTSLFTIVFQCSPVMFWNNPITAKCLPREALWSFNAAARLTTDIIVLILPIRVIWMLKLSFKEKWVVTAFFLFGALAGVVTVIRIYYMIGFINNMDFTYSMCYATLPSILESSIALIATSLPSLKVLFVAIFQRIKNYKDRRVEIVSIDRSKLKESKECDSYYEDSPDKMKSINSHTETIDC